MAVLKVDMIIEGDIQSEKRDPKANPFPWNGRQRKAGGSEYQEKQEDGAFPTFQPTEHVTHYFLRITGAFLFPSLYI